MRCPIDCKRRRCARHGQVGVKVRVACTWRRVDSTRRREREREHNREMVIERKVAAAAGRPLKRTFLGRLGPRGVPFLADRKSARLLPRPASGGVAANARDNVILIEALAPPVYKRQVPPSDNAA